MSDQAHMNASIVSFDRIEGRAVARIACPSIGDREARVVTQEVAAATYDAGDPRAVIDLSKVTMLPSVGLGMLITLSKGCKGGGGKLVLFGLDKNIEALLKMSKLDKLLVIAKDETQAIKKAK